MNRDRTRLNGDEARRIPVRELFANARAAIFDMDGVLADTEAAHLVAWTRLAEEHLSDGDREVPEDLIRQTFGQTNDIIIPALWEAAGAEPPGERLAEFSDQKEVFYREEARGKLSPLPGVEDILDWLEAEKMPMAIGTSAPSANAEFLLEEFGWQGRFDEVVHRGRFERGKPAPDCFLCGAELLGIPPQEIIVFEDSVHGLEGARTGGFQPCALATAGDEDELRPRADWVLRDFRDISC